MAITFESVNKSNNDNFHVKPFVHSVIRGGGGGGIFQVSPLCSLSYFKMRMRYALFRPSHRLQKSGEISFQLGEMVLKGKFCTHWKETYKVCIRGHDSRVSSASLSALFNYLVDLLHISNGKITKMHLS